MGVVAVPRGKPWDCLRLAASRAFWTLPRSYLESLCNSRGWALQASLIDRVWHMVLQVLGDMEDDALYSFLLQRAFPSELWASAWLHDESLLEELDNDARGSVKA